MSQSVANKKVLIIDDETYMLDILVDEMNLHGIQCVTESDGKRALELIEREKPDAIVSDFLLPGLNGIELLKFLRALKINVPVIWITGNADDHVKKEAWRLGVFHIFEKPFPAADVAREVIKALQLSEDLWLTLKPQYLTEKFISQHYTTIQVDLEKATFDLLQRRCLDEAQSINSMLNALLREILQAKK